MDSRDADQPDDQIVHPPLAEIVYRSIKDRIMDLRIPPQSHINIDQLARDLGVSNTPIREALTRVCSEGLVERKSRFGFRSSAVISEPELRELFFMRQLLEGATTQLAAVHADRRELTRVLKGSLEEMREIEAKGRVESEPTYFRTFSDADAKFHAAIAKVAENRMLAEALKSLNSHVHSYRLSFHLGMSSETIVEHQNIIDALGHDDASAAVAAMHRHLNRSLSRLLRVYDGDASMVRKTDLRKRTARGARVGR